jgi:hypothetical protein
MQSGADDGMVLKIAKQQYKNWTGAEFKRFHWWEVVRCQPKWRARSDAPSTMDAFISLSEVAIEEKVTHPTDWDRVKTVTRKGKRKEDLSSQSGSFSVMCDIMSPVKKLVTSFIRTHMWKQYNKLRKTNTTDMYAEELISHRETLRVIKKDFNFATQNAAEVQGEDDE